ncbi:hypothetical protein NC652_038889 [Populus alba x Populus x berolinensis]|nr:hypothetical protein NC652_038889 [Populus alba x Populus x berolinensis]
MDCCCSPSVLQNLNPSFAYPTCNKYNIKHPHQVILQQHNYLFYPFQQQQRSSSKHYRARVQGTPQKPFTLHHEFQVGAQMKEVATKWL